MVGQFLFCQFFIFFMGHMQGRNQKFLTGGQNYPQKSSRPFLGGGGSVLPHLVGHYSHWAITPIAFTLHVSLQCQFFHAHSWGGGGQFSVSTFLSLQIPFFFPDGGEHSPMTPLWLSNWTYDAQIPTSMGASTNNLNYSCSRYYKITARNASWRSAKRHISI